MDSLRIVMESQPHNRTFCPVCCDVELEPQELEGCALTDEASGLAVPFQVQRAPGGSRIHWIMDALAATQQRSYLLAESSVQAVSSVVTVGPEQDARLPVRIGQQLFANYHFSTEMVRPFLYPIVGPFGAGVTRAYPMEVMEGDSTDHPHHKSIYVAWGDVNGSDNWSEEEGCGRVVHRYFEKCESGPAFGSLVALNDWVDADGKKLMEDRTEYRFYNLPSSMRMFDLRVTFYATEGDVRFGDTKEGGIISVRVASSMQGNRGGRIENSVGGVSEAETWGKRASWCDYCGNVAGHLVGLAVFDHPSNLRYPTYWHVRDYGLMTANVFGLSHFLADPEADGTYVVPAGEKLSFKYRVYVHAGGAREGTVAQKYADWVFPVSARVESLAS